MSELAYKEVLNSFADAVIASDQHDRIVYINRSGERLLGWTQQELAGRPLTMIMPERFRAAHHAGFERFVRTHVAKIVGKPVRVPVQRKDGTEVEIELTLTAFQHDGNDLIVASIRDLRERIELEQQIRTNRRVSAQYEVMRALVDAESLEEAAPKVLEAVGATLEWDVGAVWMYDEASDALRCIASWSARPERFEPFLKQTHEMTMARAAGLPGRTWERAQPQWINDVGVETNFLRLDAAVQTGLRGAFAIPILVDSRVLGVAEFFSTDPRAPDEELLRTGAAVGAYIGQFVHRTRVDEELHRSDERFRLLLDRVQDYAIIMLDADGNVLSWNDGAQRLYGYAAKDILGRPFSVFFPEMDVAAEAPARALQTAAREGRFEADGWRTRKDGSSYWANISLTALYDQHGVLRGFGNVTRDATERRKAEEEREQLLADLQEALHARDEFLSIASHELKTPLTSVKLSVEALERHASRPESIADSTRLDRIRRQIDRVNKLVSSLLDISRITANRLDFVLEDVDLGAVVQDSLSQFKDDLNRARCALRLRADTAIIGRWDRVRLDQMVANLLSNAIKYGAGRPIEIDLQKSGTVARLSVRDYGIGISKEDQKRIFARFERAVPVKHYGGFGLGLWITRQIVEGMGGTVSVHSDVGDGSTFTVDLPLSGPPAAIDASAAPTPVAPQDQPLKQ